MKSDVSRITDCLTITSGFATSNTSSLFTILPFCSKLMLSQRELRCRSIARSPSGVRDTASMDTAQPLIDGSTEPLVMKTWITSRRHVFENTFQEFGLPVPSQSCVHTAASNSLAACGCDRYEDYAQAKSR